MIMITFSVIQIVSSIGCSRSLRKSSYRLVMCFATISSAIQNDQFQALERKTYADILNCSPILLD